VSVTARAVSSTGIMPVHFEPVDEVVFLVMCSPLAGSPQPLNEPNQNQRPARTPATDARGAPAAQP
jgi:hypothetical protein